MVASQAKAEHLLYIYRHTNYCSGGGEYQQRSIKNSKIYLFTWLLTLKFIELINLHDD
jgi:hypothetical protein